MGLAVVQNHSPLSWSVSTWSTCLIFSADWYKKTGFSNRTGCCLLLPKKKRTQTEHAKVIMTPGRLLTFIQRGSMRRHADSVFTHQALGCELGHLMDHTVGKVQHTYTAIKNTHTQTHNNTQEKTFPKYPLMPAEWDSCHLICGFMSIFFFHTWISCHCNSTKVVAIFNVNHRKWLEELLWILELEAQLHNFPVSTAPSRACQSCRDPTCFWHWCRTWCSDWRTWGWVGYSWRTPGAGRQSQTAGKEEAAVWNS